MGAARRSALVAILLVAAGAPVRVQSGTARPDIVILLTDQQRWDAFGAGGASDMQTPAMDRLAREGVHFTRAFVATPQCSASRAALITGRYPHRTGVMGNTVEGPKAARAPVPEGMSPPLDRSLPTIARVFGSAGYDTAYFGKWHLGGTPGDYGFEVHDARLQDETLAGRVVDFLKRRVAGGARKPLLLIVSWLNPHDIYGALKSSPDERRVAAAPLPANLADTLRQKPFPQRHYLEEDQGRPYVGAGADVWRRYRAHYGELVERVDRDIAVVLDAVPRGDVAPITVFSSDHGDLGGAHGLPYKGPAMYDELIRVPLVVSWPGHLRPARSEALAGVMDVLPTLCDLTGVRAPAGIDGLSLRRVAERRAPSVREMIFGEYFGKQAWRVPIRMVRTAQWKYVRYLNYGEELYDLTSDPGELRNLIAEPLAASTRARLSRELDDWIRRTGDPFPTLTVTDRSGRVVTSPAPAIR